MTWYYAAEINGMFGNECEAHIKSKDRENLNSWTRISQFLPWMEIGVNSPFYDTGYVLTHAFSKKFMDMLEGVPNDLMQWIVEYDQKYLSCGINRRVLDDVTDLAQISL